MELCGTKRPEESSGRPHAGCPVMIGWHVLAPWLRQPYAALRGAARAGAAPGWARTTTMPARHRLYTGAGATFPCTGNEAANCAVSLDPILLLAPGSCLPD